MPDYLNQTEIKNRQELIKYAINYFRELVKKNYPQDKARLKVLEATGVML